jgi:D-alanine-D-alanine ligase
VKNLKNKVIGVLMGGISAEREVSIRSGLAVAKALNKRGYNIKEIDVTTDSIGRLKEEQIDIAFIALHGRFGEDGTIQGMLELLKIPYTGSSHTASAIAINKLLTKQILKFYEIPVTPFEIFNIRAFKSIGRSSKINLELPLVVKPINEGSSIGVSVVKRKKDLKDALNKAFAYDDTILIEKYIKAREIQVGILNNKALGVIEVIPNSEFYDYYAKYNDKKTLHIFPAKLEGGLYEKAMDIGLRAHKALGCSGATRVDFLLDDDDNFYVLEVNTLPGMTEVSLLPEIAKGSGVSFPSLCEGILKDAKLHVKSAAGIRGH